MNKEQRREYAKKYREKHKNKIREYQKKYWAEHGEEINAKRRNRKCYKARCKRAIEYIKEHQTKEYWADEEQLDYVDIFLDEGEIIKVIKILKGEIK